jgi:hypothetical protein
MLGFNPRKIQERWQSGRMHRFRKPAGSKDPREFESPPLRRDKRPRVLPPGLFIFKKWLIWYNKVMSEKYESRGVPSLEESEKILPQMNAAKFLPELSVRDNDTDAESIGNMLDKRGWTLIGWADSNSVRPKPDKPYVVMFERESDGLKRWFHFSEDGFICLAIDRRS